MNRMDQHDPAEAMPSPPVDVVATAAVPLPAMRPATYPYHPGDLILTGYRLMKRLGQGGFGEVWRADAPGGMGVAIKVIANLNRREGGREYRALQTVRNVRHAHIVPLFGVWLKDQDGRVLGDAELQAAEKRILSGGHGPAQPAEASLESLELIVAMGLGDQTLFDRLREAEREGRTGLPIEELLPWMQQAALALDHFNSASRRSKENATAIQHCDIKPQNMLLVGDVVQVCDFGLARAQGEVRATSNTMASLAYAAPEMVSPPHDPSPTTDQYSLALSYIELRTGRLPYAELTPMTILQTKLDGRFDLSGLGTAESVVLQRALSVDPRKRWPSCTDFIKALRSSVPHGRDSLPIEVARPAAPATRPPPPVADVHAATVAAPAWSAPAAAAAERQVAAPVADRGRRLRIAGAVVGGLSVLVAAIMLIGSGVQPRGQTGGKSESAAAALDRAKQLESQNDLRGAAAAYAEALADRPDDLAAVLWSLQTKAADAGRPADSVPMLERLDRLFAASSPPRVDGVSRWDVVNTLAWYEATEPTGDARMGERARVRAEEALRLAGDDRLTRAQSLDTLAAAAARAGDIDEALRRIEEAIAIAADPSERASFARHRDRYAQRRPWNWDDP